MKFEGVMTGKAPVTPEVMHWPRETARLSIKEAAKIG